MCWKKIKGIWISQKKKEDRGADPIVEERPDGQWGMTAALQPAPVPARGWQGDTGSVTRCQLSHHLWGETGGWQSW